MCSNINLGSNLQRICCGREFATAYFFFLMDEIPQPPVHCISLLNRCSDGQDGCQRPKPLLAILVDYEILLSGKSFSGKNKAEALLQAYIKPNPIAIHANDVRVKQTAKMQRWTPIVAKIFTKNSLLSTKLNREFIEFSPKRLKECQISLQTSLR